MESYRVGWMVAAWARSGAPPWPEVERILEGRPPVRRSPEELLRVMKAAVKRFGGKHIRRGKEVPRG